MIFFTCTYLDKTEQFQPIARYDTATGDTTVISELVHSNGK